jgi:hypothetical protein
MNAWNKSPSLAELDRLGSRIDTLGVFKDEDAVARLGKAPSTLPVANSWLPIAVGHMTRERLPHRD